MPGSFLLYRLRAALLEPEIPGFSGQIGATVANCSQPQLHPALTDRPAAGEATVLEPDPDLLPLDARAERLSLGDHGKTLAGHVHLHGFAGCKPLPGLQRTASAAASGRAKARPSSSLGSVKTAPASAAMSISASAS